MALNKIGDANLYVGGFVALNNKHALERDNITHVVSVMRMNPKQERFGAFKNHFHIAVDDVEDEDLLQYFPAANAFIQEGLDAGGGVLIHCAMGRSRSATVCIAYLLHQQPTLNPRSALALIHETRPFCQPNDGFIEQLEVYHKMGTPDNVVDHPMYQRWLYQRAVEESVACGQGPELEKVHFEDEGATTDAAKGDGSTDLEIRCRKCRRQLATKPYVIPHEQQVIQNYRKETPIMAHCAHVFLHPLTWMRPSLFPNPDPEDQYTQDSPLSGRLSCPNPACGVNLGKFAWPGMRCSCETWVVPGIALARARVDIVESRGKKDLAALGAGKIRMPPGMQSRDEGGAGANGKGVL